MGNETKITVEPGKQELFITREFEAPRELVFKAYTDPDLVIDWLGPCEMIMEIEKWEAKTGGSYRFIHSTKDGMSFGFHGVFHEVLAPERIIWTFEFELLPEKGRPSIETIRFEALPGNRTRTVIHSVYQSVEDRDGMAKSGMEKGVKEGHERLDELLVKVLV